MRRTIEVGPSRADARERIELTVELRDGEFESRDSLRREAMVSAQELAIPERAHREYEEAEEAACAGAMWKAPSRISSAPWKSHRSSLRPGTIWALSPIRRAIIPAPESCFRKALDADPERVSAAGQFGRSVAQPGQVRGRAAI